MNNNWYNRIMAQPPRQYNNSNQMNPLQQIQNAMNNPVAFVQEQFPDVPENIRNNPYSVLDYLSKTRGNRFTQMMQQVCCNMGRR